MPPLPEPPGRAGAATAGATGRPSYSPSEANWQAEAPTESVAQPTGSARSDLMPGPVCINHDSFFKTARTKGDSEVPSAFDLRSSICARRERLGSEGPRLASGSVGVDLSRGRPGSHVTMLAQGRVRTRVSSGSGVDRYRHGGPGHCDLTTMTAFS